MMVQNETLLLCLRRNVLELETCEVVELSFHTFPFTSIFVPLEDRTVEFHHSDLDGLPAEELVPLYIREIALRESLAEDIILVVELLTLILDWNSTECCEWNIELSPTDIRRGHAIKTRLSLLGLVLPCLHWDRSLIDLREFDDLLVSEREGQTLVLTDVLELCELCLVREWNHTLLHCPRTVWHKCTSSARIQVRLMIKNS